MIVFRCTQRLAKRFSLRLESDPIQSTGLLGDWYANLLNVGPKRLVLCLSEQTLLPILLPARKSEFPDHFFGYLHVLLKHLELPNSVVVLEAQASSKTTFAPTENRSILSCMNDFSHHAGLYIARGESPLHASLKLAEMPSKAIDFGFPRDVTRSLLLASSTG